MYNTAVIFGPELAHYGFGNSHPWGADRLYAFWSQMQKESIDKASQVIIETPMKAAENDLTLFHDRDFVSFVKNSSRYGSGSLDLGDTPSFRGVYEAACYVVGSSVKALDIVMGSKDISHAFNPIGGLHHARRGSAAGFCVFNDIGVVIECAKKRYGINKIAYVDIDAHHGDGVFYEYEREAEILIADIHEDGRYLYPGSGFGYEDGKGNAKGTKLNICLEPGAGDHDFKNAFDRVVDFLEGAAPFELLILQCGADGIGGDPLTHLKYSPLSIRYASDALLRLANKYCNNKIIALGGGGYNRNNVARAWTEVVKSLAGL